jgi:hypothetical protein
MYQRIKKSIGLLALGFVCLALVSLATFALADNGTPQGPQLGDALAKFFVNTVMPVIAALVLGLLSVLIQKISKKLGTDILIRNQELIESLALKGISYAEEKAYLAIKNNSHLQSDTKLKLAVAYVVDAMPATTPEQAQRIVESLLARVKGVGATGERAFSLPLEA